MPYDPGQSIYTVPVKDDQGNVIPGRFDASPIEWDQTGPFRRAVNGSKQYLAPNEADAEAKKPDADPRFAQWSEATNATRGGEAYLRHRGVFDANTGGWDRDFDWTMLGTTALAAAPFAALALGAGSGTSAAAATPASSASAAAPNLATLGTTGAATEAGTAAYGPLAGTYGAATTSAVVPSSLAASSATGASMGFPWAKVIDKGIDYGLNTAGNYLESKNTSDAAKAATDAQTAAINRALDLQSRMYDQGRADVQKASAPLAQFQALGASALPNLYSLTGHAPPQPVNAQVSQLMATLRAPDGSTRQVPAQDVNQWLQKGAMRV